MGTNLHITAAAILTTLALTGCTVGEQPTATNTASPQATAQPTTQPQSVAPPFSNPIVSTKPSVNPGAVASLIQPTNSTERLIVLQKGRTDPFGQIIEPIFPQTTPLRPGNISVPKLPPLPTTSQPKPTGTTAIPPKPIGTTAIKPATALTKKPMQIAQKPKPVLPIVLPGSVTSPQLTTVLPPAPQPVTARAVIVTGVVLIGKVPQAIIKVPDEPTSRYVQPGQRLVNGVLVKRIEMNQGVSPTVILEQYGIEVAKQVGEQPTQESKPATTASLGNGISVVSPQENLVGAS
ncbi:MAG: hypothetical protein NWQ43_03495 [Dolichospermum sp.]|nr:hypothetical protein [Dolichospermum sp.]